VAKKPHWSLQATATILIALGAPKLYHDFAGMANKIKKFIF
jgi:hypothetical protein